MSDLETIIFIIATIFMIGSLDDLFIDFVHFIFKLKPKQVLKEAWNSWEKLEEKPIAIMVPAWQEYDVLESMLKTNLGRIKYENYKWFIGVYPNDKKTTTIALELQEKYPGQVIVVINDKEGPTTKAQMLNKMLRVISESELIGGDDAWRPHYLAIHDAEDVIHPNSLIAINAQDSDYDFIQVPIFSLPVDTKSWVAGTYMDEFADLHLKEIPARQKLNMPIPSAGVGTFFSNKILKTLDRRFGYIFDEENLTEDYEISMRIARIGGKQQFMLLKDDQGDFIATREYFPNAFRTSIRQKTRWTVGIGLQTIMKWGRFAPTSQLPTYKNIIGKYGVWRDQKALWANPLAFVAWGLLFAFQLNHFWSFSSLDIDFSRIPYLQTILIANLVFVSIRLIQRSRFTLWLYGWKHSLFSIPRLFVGTLINGSAAMRSVHVYKNKPTKKKIEWDKTQHYFPDAKTLQKFNKEPRANEANTMH